VKIQRGWRYRAIVHGEGDFEGILGGPAGVDIWREGGGETVMARHLLHLDDGSTIEVQEVSLTVIQPRGIGPQAGPVTCPACEGSGVVPKPGKLVRGHCGNCGGEGILYPDG